MPPSDRLIRAARDHVRSLSAAGADRLARAARGRKKPLICLGAALAVAGAGAGSAVALAGPAAVPLAASSIHAAAARAGGGTSAATGAASGRTPAGSPAVSWPAPSGLPRAAAGHRHRPQTFRVRTAGQRAGRQAAARRQAASQHLAASQHQAGGQHHAASSGRTVQHPTGTGHPAVTHAARHPARQATRHAATARRPAQASRAAGHPASARQLAHPAGHRHPATGHQVRQHPGHQARQHARPQGRHPGRHPARHPAVARHQAGHARSYLIYDSVTPSAIPAHRMVATYATGGYAVSPSQLTGRGPVLWIDTTGTDPAASALDVEPGDATPSLAESWAWRRLSARPHAMAHIYTMRSEWPAVQAAVARLPWRMRDRIRWWIADPTGYPHIVPGSQATQWYWGPHYDITTATRRF